jgi:hypothetical protein
MSLHDLFTQGGRDKARRRFRLRLARRGLGLPGVPGRRGRGPDCSARATARSRRRLAAIDRALAAQAPRLASMFAMFNELAEEPVSAERLPVRGWPRPRLAQVAFFATLAAIVALTVALSTQVRTVMRPCLTAPAASSAGSSSPAASPSASSPAASFASPAASQAGGTSALAGFAPVRGLNCRAYATTNK